MRIKLLSVKKLFTAWLLVIILSCCHNFYKATSAKMSGIPETSNTISNLKNQNRFFILRNGSEAFYMAKVSINEDKTSLNAELSSLPLEHCGFKN